VVSDLGIDCTSAEPDRGAGQAGRIAALLEIRIDDGQITAGICYASARVRDKQTMRGRAVDLDRIDIDSIRRVLNLDTDPGCRSAGAQIDIAGGDLPFVDGIEADTVHARGAVQEDRRVAHIGPRTTRNVDHPRGVVRPARAERLKVTANHAAIDHAGAGR